MYQVLVVFSYGYLRKNNQTLRNNSYSQQLLEVKGLKVSILLYCTWRDTSDDQPRSLGLAAVIGY